MFYPVFPSHMRLVLLGYHTSLCYIFALKEGRGHEFWTHLKMFILIFDLLPFILNNETVDCKMKSQVTLMPVVSKFGPSD